VGESLIMKTYKLKKKFTFSLVTLMFCYVLLCFVNNNLNITGFIDKKIEAVKENEMKFIYNKKTTSDDKYVPSTIENDARNVAFDNTEVADDNITSVSVNGNSFLLLESQRRSANYSMDYYMNTYTEYQRVSKELKDQVEKDSFRDRHFGIYYIFSYDYTMGVLKELDPVIERTAKVQKIPKDLIKAVLFREIMFMGQEDMLDGMPVIGGKSMGICQIGLENVRYNESTVHGKDSILANKTDAEIMEMLQNPEQAVYFCAVQLRARAIKLTRNADIDLSTLNSDQIHTVLAEYNQSKITKTIGPIKTKQQYAEETYRYYQLFKNLNKAVK
jgi:hypothetical protein